MFKGKFFISFFIFSLLMIFTSFIKTETRLLEKQISFFENKNNSIKNEIYTSQIDYYYLSSPNNLKKKIESFHTIDYQPVKYSNIFLSLSNYLKKDLKLTKNNFNEKKEKK